MGFSFSDVDLPYMKEIIKNINTEEVTWRISYHIDETVSKGNMLTSEAEAKFVMVKNILGFNEGKNLLQFATLKENEKWG